MGIGNPVDRERKLPEFIQKRRESRRRLEVTWGERWSRSSASDFIIQTQSHEFWKRFLDELKCIISALHGIDFTGSISTFGEGIARITLGDDRLEGVSTRTDLILDGERIRCSVLNNGIFYLNFVALSDNRLSVQDIQKDVDPMDASTTAEQVVDRMLNIIEWTRG